MSAMKILVAVDGSKYSRMAIQFLTSRRTLIESGCAVDVLNVQSRLPAHATSFLSRDTVGLYYAAESEKILKPIRAYLKNSGLKANVRYAIGHPANEISAAAEKKKADLLILGSHGHSALAGMLLGSVTNEVLVRTKRAMLVVRGRAKSYNDSLRVGIAADGSRYGQEAVKYVLQHLALFGSNPQLSIVHVVHTYALTGMPSMAGIASPAFSASEVRAMQDKAFESAVAPTRALLDKRAIAANEVRLTGIPGDELSAYAAKNLDVLVIGSQGYGAFKGAVMGSAATRITARCAVPLLIVRG